MEYLAVNPFLYISFPCCSSSMMATPTETPLVRANGWIRLGQVGFQVGLDVSLGQVQTMEYRAENPFLYISFPCSSSSMTATTTEAPPVRANESTTSKISSLLKAQSMPHIVDTMPGYNILRLFTGGQRNYLMIRKNIGQALLISVKENKYIIYYIYVYFC